MFDTLRTAWRLAERVNEIEKRQQQIEDEWEDKLSRFKALAGRLAKRDAREIERMTDAGAAPDAQEPQGDTIATGKLSKDQLRAIARARGLGVPATQRRAVQ